MNDPKQTALSSATRPPRNIRFQPGRQIAGERGPPKKPRKPKAPKPPLGLDAEAAAHWKALSPALARHWQAYFSPGLSTLCRLLADADRAPPTAAMLSQMRLLLVEFGLTPRSHLARMRERSET